MPFTFKQTSFHFTSPFDPSESFAKFHQNVQSPEEVYYPWSVNDADKNVSYHPVEINPYKGVVQDFLRPEFISHNYLQPEREHDKMNRDQNWMKSCKFEPVDRQCGRMPPSTSTVLKKKTLIPIRRMDTTQADRSSHNYAQCKEENQSRNRLQEEDPILVRSRYCNGAEWKEQPRKDVGVKRKRDLEDQYGSCRDDDRNAVRDMGMEDGEIESSEYEDEASDCTLNACRSKSLESTKNKFAESEFELHRNHRIRLAPPRDEYDDNSTETKRQRRLLRFQGDLNTTWKARNPTGDLLSCNADEIIRGCMSHEEITEGPEYTWGLESYPCDAPPLSLSGNNLQLQRKGGYIPPLGGRRRPIIIDGCNVAYGSTFGKYFDSKGICVCVDHFIKKGFKEITVVVPERRLSKRGCSNPEPLRKLKNENKLVTCWSRKLPNGQWVTSYDDRMIVEIAHKRGGIIISNDRFRDLLKENPEWTQTIGHRRLGFRFIPGKTDEILFPTDPFGRHGPSLEELLRF